MNTSLQRFLVVFVSLLVLVSAQSIGAQDARGLITGIISDATGAVVPGAKVTATADDTGVMTSTITNDDGNYALLYLIPGTYTLTVERNGFRKLEQRNIKVSVGGDLKLNLKLSVGNVKTDVTVTEEAPSIQSQSADVGVTLTNEQIADLPLSDGNPFTLARLVPGAVFTGSPLYARPFDNSDVSALKVNGADGNINFGLNGAPNSGHQIGHNESVLSYMPPADALNEFKMTTNTYTAQAGHSAAASININTKSGTNKFHGTLYEQNRNEALAAMSFFDKNLSKPKPAMRLNHYGVTFGGPIDIPKVYDGHNRTFFFFATDHMIDSFPGSGWVTVPTLGQKGLDANHNQLPYFDFGSMCKSGFDATGLCKDKTSDGKYTAGQIWNPFTTVYQSGSTSNVTRSFFPFNQIPRSMVSPIAINVINFYPDPNTDPAADGTKNYYTQNQRHDYFHSYMGRVDHTLSAKQSLHFNYQQNWRWEHRDNPFGEVTNPVLNITTNVVGNDLYYTNYGGQVGDTITLSTSTFLDLRLGFNQFHDKRRPQTLGIDPAVLGLPTNATDQIKSATGVENYMPYFNIYGFQKLGNANSRYMDDITNSTYASVTLNKLAGKHMFTIGYEARLIRENSANYGDALGYYEFRENYAEQTNNNSSAEQGQGLATFLLGLPYNNSTRVDWNDNSANSRLFHGAYLQDDFKVSPKLTVNLGLRWEYEGAPIERYNRNVLGFDTSSPSPNSLAAQAAFAALPGWVNGTFTPSATTCSRTFACPISTFTLSNFQVRGGYLFTDDAHRQFYHVSPFNFQPRFGFAYAMYPKTVIRGGVGLYSVPMFGSGDNGSPGFNQDGFNQRTQAAYTTQNNALNLNPDNCVANPSLCSGTFGTLGNPFPTGAKQPYGNAFGTETFWGQSLDISPLPATGNPPIQRSVSWSFDLQQELPSKFTLTLTYAGRKSWNVERDSNYLNALAPQYFTTDQINDAYMQAWNTMMSSSSLTSYLITPGTNSGIRPGNPFNGLGGNNNSWLTTSSLSLAQLLRPYPQFGDITTGLYVGGNFYNGGSIMLDRRFKQGFQMFFTYTFSKAMEDNGFLNDWETTPQHRLSSNDAPHRITATFVGQVPFGRGRAFGSNIPKWLNAVVGGWQTGVVYQYQTGFPISLGDRYFNGDLSKLKLNLDPNNIGHGNGFTAAGTPLYGDVFDISGFYPTGGASCALQQTDDKTLSAALKAACYNDTLKNLSGYHVRTMPLNIGSFRAPGQNNWDINIVKKTRLKEGLNFELKADFLNAFNHPQFNSPNVDPTKVEFGTITGQRNLPRTIQVGAKLIF